MISLEYIPATASEVPVEKTVEFNGANYRFQLLWNDEGSFYSLLVSSQEGVQLLANKLSYGYNAIQAIVAGLSLGAKLVPLDPADIVSDIPIRSAITKESLGDGVKLYIFREAA